MQVIENGSVFTGDTVLGAHAVIVRDGLISAVVPQAQSADLPGERFDLQGGVLVPGFIDLQVNGGGGALFNDDPSVETIRRIGDAHRRFGTTGFLPTLISTDLDKVRAAIEAVEKAMELGIPGVLGLHLEGPLLNPARRGIHDAGKFQVAEPALLDLLASARRGKTLLTLAPERCENGQIEELAQRGIILAAGHTEATYEQISAAQEAGLSGFTHLYNAMSPLQSRAPGAVGAALGREHGWFGIIADGHHVHPVALRIAVRAREPGAAVLVTDAMATVGSELESFRLGDHEIHLQEGKLLNAEGTLAGSHLNMLQAVRNAAAFAGLDWYEALRMASLYPARALGLENELGRIAGGYRANLLALDADHHLQASWIDGQRSAGAATGGSDSESPAGQ